jgi:hypothetical protein
VPRPSRPYQPTNIFNSKYYDAPYSSFSSPSYNIISLMTMFMVMFVEHSFLNNPRSKTSLKAKEKVALPYETICKVITLYTLIFTFYIADGDLK